MSWFSGVGGVIVSGRRNSLLQVAEIVFTLNYSRVATKESQSERRGGGDFMIIFIYQQQ